MYNLECHKKSYSLNITYWRAIEILKIITPYLVIERKRKRAQHIINHYAAVTLRNGRYSSEQLIAKENFYQAFIAL